MNKQAWKLHQENVYLRFEVKEARRELERANSKKACAYCGYPARAGTRTCAAHHDLPAVDPGWRI